MKDTTIALFILLLITPLSLIYTIFFYQNSVRIGGEYRYYTAYEKYKSKDKEYLRVNSLHYKDKYNVKKYKNEPEKCYKTILNHLYELDLYYDSIDIADNTVADFDRYEAGVKNLIYQFRGEHYSIKRQKNNLLELKDFISDMERDLTSISLYESEINYLVGCFGIVDSIATGKDTPIAELQYSVSYAKDRLAERLEREKRWELERRQEETRRDRERYLANYKENMSQQRMETTLEYFSSNQSESEYYDFQIVSPTMSNYIKEAENSIYVNPHTPAVMPYIPSPTFSLPNIPPPPNIYSTNTNPNHVQVDGHFRSNGTYVESYMKTAPNTTIIDNFSTNPNLNPYTGEIGTIKID